MEGGHPQARGELGGLPRPGVDQRHRADDQRRPGVGPALRSRCSTCSGLAQTHVVGEDPPSAVVGQPRQPVQAGALVGPQRGDAAPRAAGIAAAGPVPGAARSGGSTSMPVERLVGQQVGRARRGCAGGGQGRPGAACRAGPMRSQRPRTDTNSDFAAARAANSCADSGSPSTRTAGFKAEPGPRPRCRSADPGWTSVAAPTLRAATRPGRPRRSRQPAAAGRPGPGTARTSAPPAPRGPRLPRRRRSRAGACPTPAQHHHLGLGNWCHTSGGDPEQGRVRAGPGQPRGRLIDAHRQRRHSPVSGGPGSTGLRDRRPEDQGQCGRSPRPGPPHGPPRGRRAPARSGTRPSRAAGRPHQPGSDPGGQPRRRPIACSRTSGSSSTTTPAARQARGKRPAARRASARGPPATASRGPRTGTARSSAARMAAAASRASATARPVAGLVPPMSDPAGRPTRARGAQSTTTGQTRPGAIPPGSGSERITPRPRRSPWSTARRDPEQVHAGPGGGAPTGT